MTCRVCGDSESIAAESLLGHEGGRHCHLAAFFHSAKLPALRAHGRYRALVSSRFSNASSRSDPQQPSCGSRSGRSGAAPSPGHVAAVSTLSTPLTAAWSPNFMNGSRTAKSRARAPPARGDRPYIDLIIGAPVVLFWFSYAFIHTTITGRQHIYHGW